MAQNPQTQTLSLEQYLLLTGNSDRRYEYYHGAAVAMSGGTSYHALLEGRMFMALTLALGNDRVCTAYIDKQVRIAEDLVFVPDGVVSCDVADHGTSVVIESPRVVVEVLSLSTHRKDRTIKLPAYKACPSIQEIIFISQDVQNVEVYRRLNSSDSLWTHTQYGASQQFLLESLDVEIAVDDLYNRLNIPIQVIEMEDE